MRKIFVFIFLTSLNLCRVEANFTDNELSKRLDYAIQPPIFSDPETLHLPANEIANRLTPILRSHLAATNYDRIFPVSQFIDHFEECKKDNPLIKPIDAFKSFKLQLLSTENRGGTCINLTYDLFHSVPQELKGYIVLAKLPGEFQQVGFPTYSHAAIVVKYQDPDNLDDRGYILLESGFDINEPIILSKIGSPVYYLTKKKGVWKFFLEGEKIICELPNKDGLNQSLDHFRMIYLTQRVDNPVECSAMPMMIVDRRLSLLSRREDGSHRAHLNIELNKKRVIWDRNNERYDPIDFDQFVKGEFLFPQWFANELYFDSLSLTNKILKVVKNKSVLDSLYIDYMNLLKETNEIGMIDDLNLQQIDNILHTIQNKD